MIVVHDDERTFKRLIGSFLAVALSWHSWHSIGWAIIHFVFGWLYVIYWLLCVWDKRW